MAASRAVLAILLILSIASAGCSFNFESTHTTIGGPAGSVGGAGQAASSVRTVVFEVLSAKVLPGRCFDGFGGFGDVCHSLQVRVDNTGFTNELSTNTLDWDAVDVNGAGHDFGKSSADSVAAGRVATIKVEFTLDDGAPHLGELLYDSNQGKGNATIDSY